MDELRPKFEFDIDAKFYQKEAANGLRFYLMAIEPTTVFRHPADFQDKEGRYVVETV